MSKLKARYGATLNPVVALHRPKTDAQRLRPSGRAPDVISELAARLPSWHLEAACRDEDPDLFFIDRGASSAAARGICGRCPVRSECLDHAIDNHLDMGIFGGLTGPQRRKLAGERGRPDLPTVRRSELRVQQLG